MRKENTLDTYELMDSSEVYGLDSDSDYYEEMEEDSENYEEEKHNQGSKENKYKNRTSKKSLRVDYEGVANTVSCGSLNYPPSSVELDLEMLNKIELWEDLSFESKNRLPQLFELSQDILALRVYTLFNAIIKNEEFSERGLYLSKLLIKFNPADYTAWYYRTECVKRVYTDLKVDNKEDSKDESNEELKQGLKEKLEKESNSDLKFELNLDLEEELDFARKITYESPKSFQPWAYRRFICTTSNSPFNEIEYVKMEVATSSKNQCAWSHLTWLIKTFGTIDLSEEFKFVKFLTGNDPYNNSAWNYKNFLMKFNRSSLDQEFVVREFCTDFLKFLERPKSESLCSFLIDMLEFVESMYSDCLSSVLESSMSESNTVTKPTDENKLKYTHGQDHKHTCQGPPRKCIYTILKSIPPRAQVLRFIKTIKTDEQVTEQLMLIDPMRADFYQSCQRL